MYALARSTLRSLAIPALGGLALAAAPLAAQQTITVFAATSLTEAFTAIGKGFEQGHPGVTVRFNFAGSQVLATQLEHGAKGEVFAAADRRWMQYAVEKRLVAGTPAVFARNRLVVVIPKSNPGVVGRLEDLGRPGVKLVLAGAQVPAGGYSREALKRLAVRHGFPRDYERRVLANVVSEEENVRAVVAKVQLREADAGIAYATDITPAIQAQVTILEIPEPENPVAEYPIAATVRGGELGGAFVAFVLSGAGQKELAARGFLPPPAVP